MDRSSGRDGGIELCGISEGEKRHTASAVADNDEFASKFRHEVRWWIPNSATNKLHR